jgi:hypothetical protein
LVERGRPQGPDLLRLLIAPWLAPITVLVGGIILIMGTKGEDPSGQSSVGRSPQLS